MELHSKECLSMVSVKMLRCSWLENMVIVESEVVVASWLIVGRALRMEMVGW